MSTVLPAVVSEAVSKSSRLMVAGTAVSTSSEQHVYTYVATGAVGATATIMGSNDGTNYVTIVQLTVALDAASGSNVDVATRIHSYKYIKYTGTATVRYGSV